MRPDGRERMQVELKMKSLKSWKGIFNAADFLRSLTGR